MTKSLDEIFDEIIEAIEEVSSIDSTDTDDIDETPTKIDDITPEESMSLIESIIYNYLAVVPKGELPSLKDAQTIAILDSILSKYSTGPTVFIRKGAIDSTNRQNLSSTGATVIEVQGSPSDLMVINNA